MRISRRLILPGLAGLGPGMPAVSDIAIAGRPDMPVDNLSFAEPG